MAAIAAPVSPSCSTVRPNRSPTARRRASRLPRVYAAPRWLCLDETCRGSTMRAPVEVCWACLPRVFERARLPALYVSQIATRSRPDRRGCYLGRTTRAPAGRELRKPGALPSHYLSGHHEDRDDKPPDWAVGKFVGRGCWRASSGGGGIIILTFNFLFFESGHEDAVWGRPAEFFSDLAAQVAACGVRVQTHERSCASPILQLANRVHIGSFEMSRI